jgi:hypothetical protein
MEEVIGESLSQHRFSMLLLVGFAGLRYFWRPSGYTACWHTPFGSASAKLAFESLLAHL